jgi:hypothetical protein
MAIDRAAGIKLTTFAGVAAVTAAIHSLGFHPDLLLGTLMTLGGAAGEAITGQWGTHLLDTTIDKHADKAAERARGVQNRDIHRLIGQTIAGILEREATDPLGGLSGAQYLKHAAAAFRSAQWMTLELTGPESVLGEPSVAEYFTGNPDAIKTRQVLTDAEWYALVEKVAGPVGFLARDAALQQAAEKLRDHFAFQLWQAAKDAWAQGDVAWPALVLRLLSLILGEVTNVSVGSGALSTAIGGLRTEIRKLTDAVGVNVAERAKRLSPEERADRAEILLAIREYQRDLSSRLGDVLASQDRIEAIVAALHVQLPSKIDESVDRLLVELSQVKHDILQRLDDLDRREQQSDEHHFQETEIDHLVLLQELSDKERQERIRRDVLGDVKRQASSWLAQSLYTGKPLTLHKEPQTHQVEPSWHSEVKLPRHPSTQPSPAEILALLSHPAIEGKLLILGGAGSGKTTALVQLVRELAIRAEDDPKEPIPVLLNLSSWMDNQPFHEWFVDQVKLKYGVRKDYGAKWRDERCIVPLFDGLDELPSVRHEICVRAINRFVSEYRPPQMVVCCRSKEYENIGTKLQLNGAIRLLPFDDEQIREYLALVGCPELWSSITEDPEFLELARSPLFLGMMTITRDGMSHVLEGPASTSERRTLLWDLYIRHALSRRGPSTAYSEAHTTTWLARLATILQEHGQSDFLIEQMQPAWLQSQPQRWLYRIGVALVTACIVYLVAYAIERLSELIPTGTVTSRFLRESARLPSVFGEVTMILISLGAGLIVAARETIVPIETVRWSSEKARLGAIRWLSKGASGGLKAGVYLGIIAGVLAGVVLVFSPGGLFDGPVSRKAGVVVGTAAGMLASFILLRIQPLAWLIGGDRPGIARVSETLLVGLFCGLTADFPIGLFVGLLYGLGITLVAGISDQVSTVPFVRPLIVGAASGLAVGVITRGLLVSSPMQVWLVGGISIGTTFAILSDLNTRRRSSSDVKLDQESETVSPSVIRHDMLRRVRWVFFGLALGLIPGVVMTLLVWSGYSELVKGIAHFLLGWGFTLTLMMAIMMMTMLTCSVAGTLLGGVCGALLGLTGPDVVRRAVPNQGILHSARNVPVFALIGTLVVGVPYGLANLASGAVFTRTVPDYADWLRLGVGSSLVVGVFGGLLPGAACIQHWVLRFTLWCSGVAPLRYQQFLDHATVRMILQRVGGRYQFIHVLLRDHFAQMQQQPSVTR